MIGALHLLTHRRNSNEARSYATDDDFQQLFATEITEVFRLGQQLTADAEKAERCLILICVFERLSILNCALFLRRSPKDMNDAIVRATNRVAFVEDQNHHHYASNQNPWSLLR